jgi:hypothetical protein
MRLVMSGEERRKAEQMVEESSPHIGFGPGWEIILAVAIIRL